MMWFAHCRIVYGEPAMSLPASFQSSPSSTVELSRCAFSPTTPATRVASTADSRSEEAVFDGAAMAASFFKRVGSHDAWWQGPRTRPAPCRLSGPELRGSARGLDQCFHVRQVAFERLAAGRGEAERGPGHAPDVALLAFDVAGLLEPP